MLRIQALVTLAALAANACLTTAHAETITVCASGCDHTSINAAIDAAGNGDVIQLAAETYLEGSVIETDGKAVTLLGATGTDGSPASILDGDGSHRVLRCWSGETSETIFENLVIRSGDSSFGAGMYIENSSPTVTNCTFTDNEAMSGGGLGAGLYLRGPGSPTLTHCMFTDNSAKNGGGLYNRDGSPSLANCAFTGNSALSFGGGIFTKGSGSLTLTNCNLTSNAASIAPGIYNEFADMTLSNCIVCGNGGGEVYGPISSGNSDNCIVEDCDDCCLDDPDKAEVGECGCGVPETDSDSDGTPDCLDNCPGDPLKTEPGGCGCGVVDTNVNGDVDCDGDYDEDDIRAGMVVFGITEGSDPVAGDADGDGDVDADDRAAVNEALGLCAADIDGDGEVNGVDLSYILGYWGVCTAP